MTDPTPFGRRVGPDCRRCAYLEGEVTFYREQMKLAANVAAGIADLDEVAPALRQAARLEYRLAELTGTLP